MSVAIAPTIPTRNTMRGIIIYGTLPFVGVRANYVGGGNGGLPRYNMLLLGIVCVTVFIVLVAQLTKKRGRRWFALITLSVIFLYATAFDLVSLALPLSSRNWMKICKRRRNSKRGKSKTRK